MTRALAIALVAAAAAIAQTQPRPDQIRNIEQIRIGGNSGDNRPGTLIRSNQINDARFMNPRPQVFEGTPDAAPTVCTTSYYRIGFEGQAARNVMSILCYTQFGLGLLLNDPAWATWWAAHKNDQ